MSRVALYYSFTNCRRLVFYLVTFIFRSFVSWCLLSFLWVQSFPHKLSEVSWLLSGVQLIDISPRELSQAVHNLLWSFHRAVVFCWVFHWFCPFFESESRSIMSDSLWPPWTIQSMQFSRLEYWVGSFSHLQGIFWTQGSNPGLHYCKQILHQLSRQSTGK